MRSGAFELKVYTSRIQRLGLRLRDDWAELSEALCVFCCVFFLFGEVVANAFGMTQADMCVSAVLLCVFVV